MKKFSKKLALMLVLAMIVGMFSGVLTASAANAPFTSNGFSFATSAGALKNSLSLTVGGKQWYTVYKDGKKVNGSAAYTVKYTTDTDGAEMLVLGTGKYNGLVRAKSVGLDAGCRLVATIFDADNEKVATISTAIYVKESAAKLEISNAAAATAEALIVGKTLPLTAVFYNAAGQSSSVRKTYVTDYLKWTSSDETIATVDAAGVVTAVKEGSVKITAATYADAKFAGTATQTATVDITVKASVAVIKTASPKSYTVINAAFDSEFAAAPDKADFIVTNTKTGIKSLISGTAVSSTDKKVVEITLYLPLVNENEYTVEYKGSKAAFTTAIGKVATVLVKDTQITNKTTTEIKKGTHYFFYDANGIDITSTIAATSITVVATPAKYGYWDGVKNIYFYNIGDTATLKVTYLTGSYDATGNAITVEGTGTLTSVDVAPVSATVVESKIGKALSSATTTLTIALNEADYFIYSNVKSGTTTLGYSNADVTYATSDTSTLLVGETGSLYGLKTGSAAVLVYYKKTLIGAVEVTVGAKREAASVVIDNPSVTVSKNVATDAKIITITVKDQYGTEMTSANVVTVEKNPGTSKDLVWVVGTKNNKVTFNGSNFSTFDKGSYSYKLTYAGKSANLVITVAEAETAVATVKVSAVGAGDLVYAATDASVDKNVVLGLTSYDKNGVLIGTVNSGYVFDVVAPNGTTIASLAAVTSGSLSIRSISGSTATGSIIKAATGVYTVKVYTTSAGGAKEGLFLVDTFTVTDTQTVPSIARVSYTYDKNADLKANFTAKIGETSLTVISVASTGSYNGDLLVSSVTARQTFSNGNYIDFVVATNELVKLQ